MNVMCNGPKATEVSMVVTYFYFLYVYLGFIQVCNTSVAL